ncbi:hypothetical protein TWF102_000036 [Orbilia oligospora]|uniref:Uncharacterized protein n=1 Tax=Orbilia oligospora TaxID=2813651 RepID=A0A7C8NKM2_ORBOL|nr:hypothetical protein TWF706_006240 [Orbilia oligospora]KAF3113373.1 hypothetical protein TWF102_000036 [Orbilia oligospora]
MRIRTENHANIPADRFNVGHIGKRPQLLFGLWLPAAVMRVYEVAIQVLDGGYYSSDEAAFIHLNWQYVRRLKVYSANS